ncbi:MAG: hypothetical protein AB7V42_07490 [Thermoleophilia bacterium]
MAWTLAMILVFGEAADDVLRAVRMADRDDDPVPFRDLVDGPGAPRPGLGEIDGWTVLLDPGLVLPDQAGIVHRATEGRHGYAFLWERASATYGLGVHEDGIRTRTMIRSAGAVAADEGEALPEESGLDFDADPAAALDELCGRLTGVELSDDATWSAPMHPLRLRPRRQPAPRSGAVG